MPEKVWAGHRAARRGNRLRRVARSAMNVAVIGGGYAGMAAAVTLAEGSVPVTVYEAGRTLGGRARRIEHPAIAAGAARQRAAHPDRRVYRDAAPDAARRRRSRAGDCCGCPSPGTSTSAFRSGPRACPRRSICSPDCSSRAAFRWRERSAVARFMLRHAPGRLPLAARYERDASPRAGAAGRRSPCASSGSRFACPRSTRRPTRIGAGIPERAARQPRRRPRSERSSAAARRSLRAFPDAGRRVDSGTRRRRCSPGAASSRSKRVAGGYAVRHGAGTASYSHVICAVPPHQAKALLVAHPGAGRASRSPSTASTTSRSTRSTCSIPQTVRLPAPMLGFDSALLQWAFDRGALCGQHGLIGAVISAGGHARGARARGARASSCTRSCSSNWALLPAPHWFQVIAEKRATFACVAGPRAPAEPHAARGFPSRRRLHGERLSRHDRISRAQRRRRCPADS